MKAMALLLLFLAACVQKPSPLPEEAEGMKLQGVRSYRGEALFDYMDGGAELFYEYGFRRLWVGEYGDGGAEVRVELFEMEDPGAAYGVLTFEGGGTTVEVAEGAFLREGILVFRKGRYFCRIIGEGELVPLGEAIARGLQGGGAPPEVIRYLPEGVEGYLYFRGALALNNFYFLSHEDVLGLRGGAEGVAYRVGKGVVVVVRYPQGPPEELEGLLEAPERVGEVLLGRSRRGWGGVKVLGKVLVLALDFPSPEEARGEVEEVR